MLEASFNEAVELAALKTECFTHTAASHVSFNRRKVTSEKNRELALGDMQKKLRATQITIEESREVCDSQRQVVQHVLPQISQVARLLELESERLREAGHASEVSDFPTRPLALPPPLAWVS
ncbi:unnamed protein product [Symbiodinium sp. CCMP2456]|nr:unnamed protein product [Symbiodinium sp. CCMP2456]